MVQDATECGFDFVATPLRQHDGAAPSGTILQPLSYGSALLAPPGRSGQVHQFIRETTVAAVI